MKVVRGDWRQASASKCLVLRLANDIVPTVPSKRRMSFTAQRQLYNRMRMVRSYHQPCAAALLGLLVD